MGTIMAPCHSPRTTAVRALPTTFHAPLRPDVIRSRSRPGEEVVGGPVVEGGTASDNPPALCARIPMIRRRAGVGGGRLGEVPNGNGVRGGEWSEVLGNPDRGRVRPAHTAATRAVVRSRRGDVAAKRVAVGNGSTRSAVRCSRPVVLPAPT